MKPFYPTYLYVKTHNVTGLKYFGKTTGDPYKYRGSGKYWLSHLKIHGNNVTTEIVGFFESRNECESAALTFSINNNIVSARDSENKKIWANQILENGLDGGATKWGPLATETKQKISDAHKGMTASEETKQKIKVARAVQCMEHMKVPKSIEHKDKISKSLVGRKQTAETVVKRAASLKGHKVSDETRQKISESHKGKKLSDSHIQKLKSRVVSPETKEKIKKARAGQVFSTATKEKLSGKVIAINKQGEVKKISKEVYHSQTGDKESWEWIFHRCKEAEARKLT
jgi:NUMOD3 motif